jgi:hypothetical protein
MIVSWVIGLYITSIRRIVVAGDAASFDEAPRVGSSGSLAGHEPAQFAPTMRPPAASMAHLCRGSAGHAKCAISLVGNLGRQNRACPPYCGSTTSGPAALLP